MVCISNHWKTIILMVKGFPSRWSKACQDGEIMIVIPCFANTQVTNIGNELNNLL